MQDIADNGDRAEFLKLLAFPGNSLFVVPLGQAVSNCPILCIQVLFGSPEFVDDLSVEIDPVLGGLNDSTLMAHSGRNQSRFGWIVAFNLSPDQSRLQSVDQSFVTKIHRPEIIEIPC